MFKVNNKDNRTAAMTRVFAVNFEHISHIVLVFPLLSLNKWMPIELRLKKTTIYQAYMPRTFLVSEVFYSSFDMELIFSSWYMMKLISNEGFPW